ncbi:hypothetical protein [Nostoc sp. ChiSLP03a]|uniref:hypothetical protein n=1 Tax=Nostoc sp. ChiSLP03a TaxID=3075380 RepID=UPI002AD4B5A3|nr:hypothetical protein [Nostoc sp. ChiSLP03a]MDZ8214708.1 hypothetical protein [Nostoc sp. ChiSLP03a]
MLHYLIPNRGCECLLKEEKFNLLSKSQNSWRLPTLAEHQLIFSDQKSGSAQSWSAEASIGIFRIPDMTLKIFQKYLPLSLSSPQIYPQEYADLLQFYTIENLLPILKEAIAEWPMNVSSLELLRVHTAPPGMQTITLESPDPERCLLVGMHMDSIDALPLRSRYKARSRLCINIGSETRHLLYINQTIEKLFAYLPVHETKQIAKYYRGQEVGYEFMKRNPYYPVIRLALAPGECYIAPTDNLLHDASTVNKSYVDISLHSVGHFQVDKSAIW